MTFVDTGPKTFFSHMLDLIAIETGNRRAREYWQRVQLRNLLTHATARSSFWRKRIEIKYLKSIERLEIPILSRGDVATMVASEGHLLTSAEGFRVGTNATSGSSGTRLTFYFSEINTTYNEARNHAQYLIEARDLTLNRTRLRSNPEFIDNGFRVEKYE